MLLLHLSDIHFRARDTATSQDPNLGLRAALVDDVEKSFERLGAMPRCILVSGDVAFGGAKEEYDYAARWLDNLCYRLDLAPASVFVVPGNHDVDRAVTDDLMTQAVHDKLKAEATAPSSDAFREMLTHGTAGKVLYNALENYNAFAARYSCALAPPNDTLAEERLDLGNGWTLRLVGLNSAVLSSRADREGTLHVDNASFSLRPEPGCLTVVMCHHPYHWLAFGDQLRDILDGVAPLQLFGHEHTVRPEMTRDVVRMRSGAVHPERDWGDWNPGYNIIDVDVAEKNDGWYAAIMVHVRTWQKAPPQFVPLFDRDHPVFEAQVKLGVSPPPAKTLQSPGGGMTPESVATADADMPSAEATPDVGPRALTFRFFELPYPNQAAIVSRLGLSSEADANKPASIRFSHALRRAKDRGLLPSLADEIAKEEQTL